MTKHKGSMCIIQHRKACACALGVAQTGKKYTISSYHCGSKHTAVHMIMVWLWLWRDYDYGVIMIMVMVPRNKKQP